MPIPFIIAGLAVVAGGYGVKKSLDAKSDFERAERTGNVAKKKHQDAVLFLDEEKDDTNRLFTELGELKVNIFSDQLKHLVDVIKKSKKAKSSLKDFNEQIERLNLPEMEAMVLGSLEIEKGIASGAVSGALMGLGAYGSVGLLASASTGTAIASLSGAAATNATLAWLGGGSLAAGGFGIAGGTAVLGGIVAGPAIAITGLVLASKAEQALSEACAYSAQVDEAVAEIDAMKVVLQGLQANAAEMGVVLNKLADKFDEIKVFDDSDENAFLRMMSLGTTLKKVLNTPIIETDGTAVKNLDTKIQAMTAGFIEYHG
jgi:hypothetical protein